MDKLGVGIIGAGWVAGEHIRAFQRNPDTEVLAICSRNEANAKLKARECYLDCSTYAEYKEILARDDIHIVSIATPPNLHEEQSIAAAQAGKHILLEKPMATSIEGARLVRNAIAKADVKSLMGFVLRWNPLFDIITALIEDNAIGNIFFAEVDYFNGFGPWYKQFEWNVKKDVGVSSLLSAGCHAIDALRYFMGGDIVEVCQYSTSGNGPDFADYQYDPTSVTILKFSDGRIAKVASCIECVQPYIFNINLIGSHGSIRNNRIYSNKKFPGQNDWIEIPTVLPDTPDPSHDPFRLEVDHLVKCIKTNKESPTNATDAFKTHEIVFAADKSAKEGQPVRLPLK